ncbi:MAG: hypothetical protein WBC00_01045 [Candidatus Omnitrophota bacterium]
MVDLLEKHILDNWGKFSFSFPPPAEMNFVFFRGFRKIIFYVFKNSDPGPFGILKISKDPVAFSRLSNEYDVLSVLSENESVKGMVPRPLASFELEGHVCTFQTALEGSPLVYSVRGIREKRGLAEMKKILKIVTKALLSIHKTKEEGGVIEQGDFNIPNIFISGNEIKICDWEYSKVGGKPLKDLLEFSLSYVFFARYIEKEIIRERPGLEDFMETFFSENPHTKIVWENIRLYNDEMKIKDLSLEDIFLEFSSKHLKQDEAGLVPRQLGAFLSKS